MRRRYRIIRAQYINHSVLLVQHVVVTIRGLLTIVELILNHFSHLFSFLVISILAFDWLHQVQHLADLVGVLDELFALVDGQLRSCCGVKHLWSFLLN